MGLWLIAERRQPTVVVVHTKDLAFQWIARIEQFLGIPADEVGLIGAGKNASATGSALPGANPVSMRRRNRTAHRPSGCG
ncbi:hypothetical protein [Desulfosarcina cetonica]|uniref:hypothetical protein n=1 Tax=Desulfosarcina cetonica TaxID=90730 RepID=UPI0009FB0A2C|nr:hypothetical protein [Desulfosarcina cetonica]